MMKAPQWQQNVLLVSDDLEIKAIFTPVFGVETNLITAQDAFKRWPFCAQVWGHAYYGSKKYSYE